MNNFEDFIYNQLQPDYSISPNNFKYWKKDITKIMRYLPRVIDLGIPEHFLITGKQNNDKKSFVEYIGHLTEDKYNMAYIYCNNKGAKTVNELISKLLEDLLNEFNEKMWGQKIVENFFNHFQEIDIHDFGFEFKDKPYIVENIKNNFIEFLVEICDNLEDKNGIYVVIDDVNELSKTPEFVNWYKSLFETLYLNDEYVPVSFTLITDPSKFHKFYQHNPSFTRMFNVIEIDMDN